MLDETGTSSKCIDVKLHRPWGKKKSPSKLEDAHPAEEGEQPPVHDTAQESVEPPAEPEEVPPDADPPGPEKTQSASADIQAETATKPKDTPSIFNRKKERNQEEVEPTSVTNKKSSEFSEEDLQGAWKQFAEERANVGDTDKLILNRKLSKGAEHKVIIHLASQLEVSFLEKLEVDLIQHLRSALENDHITLEREVLQEEETKKLYTGKDIFDHMVKENPALKDLKDRLGLDFDY